MAYYILTKLPMIQIQHLLPIELTGLAGKYCHVRNVRGKRKTRNHVDARVLISYVLLYNGMESDRIGNIVGRDRANITHYKGLIMEDVTMQKLIVRFSDWMLDKGYILPDLLMWKQKIIKT